MELLITAPAVRVDAISMSERLALICLALVAPHATTAYSLAPAVPRNIAHRCPPLAACATLLLER